MSKLSFFCLLLAAVLAIDVPTYNENLALRMINASASTYYIEPEAINHGCHRCYPQLEVIEIFQTRSLLAMVGYDQSINSVVIAFRGSDNNLNWGTDFRMRPSFYANKGCITCTVHAGFRDNFAYLCLRGLKKRIQAAAEVYPKANIIFTGHSLGGALANLASVNFVEQNPKQAHRVIVYTLGQPRVGDMRYAEYHNEKVPHYFRIVHAKDLVPHQPPHLLLGAIYRHSGVEVWYQQGMLDKKICVGDSNDCSNSIGSLLNDYEFADHSSNQYLKLNVVQASAEL